MNYYKLINNNEFIGVGTTLDFRKYQKKHNIFLACNESEAQYMQRNDAMYRASWMLQESVHKECDIVDIIQIDKEEYDVLFDAIESNDKIVIDPEPDEKPPVIEEDDKITIDFVRESKIADMKSKCNKAITAGFDIELSDENVYHFSLTVQDQLNLITSSQMIATGADAIPYHADGELCRYYSVEDMQSVIDMSNTFKNYHISYFNSLRAYINSLANIDDISAVFYGIEVPEEYQSQVFQEYDLV